MNLYRVAFSAVFYAQVEAETEEAAKEAATKLATAAHWQLDDMTLQADDWIVIDPTDITSIQLEDEDV